MHSTIWNKSSDLSLIQKDLDERISFNIVGCFKSANYFFIRTKDILFLTIKTIINFSFFLKENSVVRSFFYRLIRALKTIRELENKIKVG